MASLGAKLTLGSLVLAPASRFPTWFEPLLEHGPVARVGRGALSRTEQHRTEDGHTSRDAPFAALLLTAAVRQSASYASAPRTMLRW